MSTTDPNDPVPPLPEEPTPPGTNPDDGHPSQADRTTTAPPPGTPRPDPEQISQGLSDYGVVSAGGHVGPEKGDQAAGETTS